MSSEHSNQPTQRSALLIEEHLTRIAEEMTVEMIMTPMARLVTTVPDAAVNEALASMRDTFDQLPVVLNRKICGMLFRSNLPENSTEQSVSEYVTGNAELTSIRLNDKLSDAVKALSTVCTCVVFDPRSGDFCGLLHFADLNRQAIRIYCYLWLSALEMGFAELLSIEVPDYNNWIHLLPEMRQVTVLGRFSYERRQNIELSPVEGLDLSDLVRLCGNQPTLLKRLGFSKTQFDKRASRVITMRNAAMHPVRSLVRTHDSVLKFGKRLSDLRELVDATQAALKIT